jgi:protein-L-isoaspartate(D-aspartate) O-methyltransferase
VTGNRGELNMQPKKLAALGLGAILLSMPSTQSPNDPFEANRVTMVRQQIERRGVRNDRVLEAMRAVPRHLFVPLEYRDEAYNDHPLPIGLGQTISQPYIVAYMTDVISPDPDDVVLEVGTGSGYQAAVLAQVVNRVYTVEIFQQLAEEAAARFRELDYANIELKSGDGYYGWEEHGPFDAIVVTAAPEHIPPPLIRQLKPGGIMVIPVGNRFQVQTLVLVQKDTEGKVTSKNLLPVRFVPLLGKHPTQ